MNLNEMFTALSNEALNGVEIENEPVHEHVNETTGYAADDFVSQAQEHDDFERGAEDMERRARRIEAEREAELEAQADIAAQEVESDRIARENARRAKYGKAKMTAEEAKRFEHFSAKNAATLESVCEECTAYEDWFTFNRWIAQGKVVQKGQKGTKITVYFPKEEKLRDGTKKKVLVPKDVACFCRHQVKKLDAVKGRAA